MTINKNLSLFYFIITIVSAVSSGCDSPVAKYEPQNQDEREIIAVVIQYQDSRNHFDIEKLLSLLHNNGQFTFECGRMVSKSVIKEELPILWSELKSGNSAVIPLVHECINGDYHKSGELNNPQIAINDDKAKVTVMFTKGFTRLLLYFSMLRENDRWLITRTEWGHN